MLNIRLSRDIDGRLENLAKKICRTKEYCAREAILEYLSDMEDYHLVASRVARNMKRIPLKIVGKRLAREEMLPPTDILEEVRRLGLSTPAESTRMIRADRRYGSATCRSRQILRARKSLISLWRGMDEDLRAARLTYTE